MRNCFGIGVLALAAACVLEAANAPGPATKITMVVRADPRTGRLVRSRVVTVPRISRIDAAHSSQMTLAAPPAGISAVVEEAARRHELDPLLVHSVISVESNYDQYAISPKGAEGLMQLIPSTALQYGVRNPFDATDNVLGGVRYLKHLMELYDKDLTLALAAYNAGEAAVARYNNQVPPYPETRNYVYQVQKKLGQAQRAVAKKQASAPVKLATRSPEEHRPIETLMDSEGRIYYLTR